MPVPILALLLVAQTPPEAPAPRMESLTGVRDSYPRLSPDGTQLAFHSNRSGRQAIWIAAADGSNPRLLFDDPAALAPPSAPFWSPDGKLLAFTMTPAGADARNSELFTIRADGTGIRRLTHSPGADSHPHFGRSGRIYFNSSRGTPDPGAPAASLFVDIYSIAADGSDVRRHTDCRSSCTYPEPSPDERFIVYRRAVDEPGTEWDGSAAKNSEIFVSALDGSSNVNVSRHPAYDGWPAWSPDGRWVVFASTRNGGRHHAQIYAVRPDGTGLRQLTRGPWSHIQPSFKADGSRLLVNEHSETPEFEVGHLTQFDPGLPK